MATEIWISSSVDTDKEFRIKNPQVIPLVGASLDTPNGIRHVHKLHLDYNEQGDCRVHVYVHKI